MTNPAMKLLAALLLTGCTTVTTRTTAPDGTVTETITRGPDASAMQAITATALAVAPRAHVVREEKSATDMRELLRGWRGPSGIAAHEYTRSADDVQKMPFRDHRPITTEEIASRWKQ